MRVLAAGVLAQEPHQFVLHAFLLPLTGALPRHDAQHVREELLDAESHRLQAILVQQRVPLSGDVGVLIRERIAVLDVVAVDVLKGLEVVRDDGLGDH